MNNKLPIANRFRGFLPVIVDVETAGFDSKKDALLEVAIVMVEMDEDDNLVVGKSYAEHIEPFAGANLDESALKFNGIDPWHPFRMAKKEQDALGELFKPVRKEVKKTGCSRAVLVGHNAWFDLHFILAATKRANIKRVPFHSFSSFDTASMSGLVYGQTVLSRAANAAGMQWDESKAHSALYDAEQTAELFCRIVNKTKDIYNPV